MMPMFREKTRNIIGQKLNLLAFDEKDRFVGMLGCGIDQGVEEIERVFGPRGKPVLETKEDYAQGRLSFHSKCVRKFYNHLKILLVFTITTVVLDIQNGPWKSINANRYHVMYDSALKQTNKFLPEGIQRIGSPRALLVHPEFRGEGIGILLFAETRKLLRSLNCDGWVTFAVVDGSRNVTMRPENGMKILFTFPYNKFKENGVPIFDELIDGTKEHSIMYSSF